MLMQKGSYIKLTLPYKSTPNEKQVNLDVNK